MAAIIRKSKYPNVVYELKPDVDREFGHIRLHINGAGMRKSREYAVEKPMRTVRIVGVGDSGMFGWGVHQGENYMDVLESNLNARADGKVYETLNFGVPGYNTQLEVETLKSKGLVYKPDIVVVGWCDNDFGLPFFIPQQGQWSRKDVSFLYNLMFDRKAFSDLALNQIADQRKYSKDQIPERFRAGMDITGVRNEFAELKALGEKNGFQLLVIGPMQKEVLKILSDLEIVHYNTYNRIAANEYPADYYVHAMHPRAGGHRVLAERLEREMKERGWF
jgi:lysophospholipase L1-like esterase